MKRVLSGSGVAGSVRALALAGGLVLAACSSPPPPADWRLNALGSAERATEAWLRGDSDIEAVEFERARQAVASSARPDLMARLQLLRCAGRVAALELAPCEGYLPWASAAAPPEQAYARFLAGRALTEDAPLLPAAHRPLLQAAPGAQAGALAQMPDPLARLVAAGVLLQRGVITPEAIRVAVDTASERGWRRPLLAWLGVQRERASAAGDRLAQDRIDQRLRLLQDLPAVTPAPAAAPAPQ